MPCSDGYITAGRFLGCCTLSPWISFQSQSLRSFVFKSSFSGLPDAQGRLHTLPLIFFAPWWSHTTNLNTRSETVNCLHLLLLPTIITTTYYWENKILPIKTTITSIFGVEDDCGDKEIDLLMRQKRKKGKNKIIDLYVEKGMRSWDEVVLISVSYCCL